jgi:hypothetical protein
VSERWREKSRWVQDVDAHKTQRFRQHSLRRRDWNHPQPGVEERRIMET